MITNPTHAPTQQDTWRRREQDHYDRPRGTTLGPGCCPQCGAPWEMTKRGAVRNGWGCWCEWRD